MPVAYEKQTVRALRQRAAQRRIPHYSTLRKAQLCAALRKPVARCPYSSLRSRLKEQGYTVKKYEKALLAKGLQPYYKVLLRGTHGRPVLAYTQAFPLDFPSIVRHGTRLFILPFIGLLLVPKKKNVRAKASDTLYFVKPSDLQPLTSALLQRKTTTQRGHACSVGKQDCKEYILDIILPAIGEQKKTTKRIHVLRCFQGCQFHDVSAEWSYAS